MGNQVPVKVVYEVREVKHWEVHMQASFGEGIWSHMTFGEIASCGAKEQAQTIVDALVAQAEISTEVVLMVTSG